MNSSFRGWSAFPRQMASLVSTAGLKAGGSKCPIVVLKYYNASDQNHMGGRVVISSSSSGRKRSGA